MCWKETMELVSNVIVSWAISEWVTDWLSEWFFNDSLFVKDCSNRKLVVVLATKDETSRGVAKACLLSIAVVEQNHEKPRWRLTVFIEIAKTETKTITITIAIKTTIVNWNYNNIITNAWIYLNWYVRHERKALRAYVDNAIKITTINVN